MRVYIGAILLFILFGGHLLQENRFEIYCDVESSISDTVIIAFGSCSKQDLPQVLWDDVLKCNPDTWIWLGDNIYGDSDDPEILRSKYQKQKANSDYQKVLQKALVYGIWDDHDYGVNDGGKEFEIKDISKDLMFDFLDIPEESLDRQHSGSYQSYDIFIKGISVKLILLDSRYFRDAPAREGKQYLPNLEGTILGEEQWSWLETELLNDTADLTLIGNGIQVISEEHRFEKWSNFPNERQRLFNVIQESGVNKVMLLSGDRHISELSKIELEGIKYPIFDVTSSGLTHTYTGFKGELNRHRVGDVVTERSFGLLEISKDSDGVRVKLKFMGDDNKVLRESVLF